MMLSELPNCDDDAIMMIIMSTELVGMPCVFKPPLKLKYFLRRSTNSTMHSFGGVDEIKK